MADLLSPYFQMLDRGRLSDLRCKVFGSVANLMAGKRDPQDSFIDHSTKLRRSSESPIITQAR